MPGEPLGAAVARLSGGAAGGLEAVRAGSGPAPRQAAPKQEDDGSGTDTDEDGELIAKARQKALAERQRAATVIGKKRGPGTGSRSTGQLSVLHMPACYFLRAHLGHKPVSCKPMACTFVSFCKPIPCMQHSVVLCMRTSRPLPHSG
jgi:hypothetical protein